MTIPFTKAQAAGNDFLLSWADQVSASDLASAARTPESARMAGS
jgi:hypothetical protein